MRVLLIEDREIAADQFRKNFSDADINCDVISSSENAVACLAGSCGADVMVISLPIETGDVASLIADIRSRRVDIGILVMQDMRNSDEAADLLDIGADDVVSKPIQSRQLASRLGAIVRRQAGFSEPVATIGGLTYYFDGRAPSVDGIAISLTPRERSLLECLVKKAGKVVTRNMIYASLYGNTGEEVDPKIIDVYICKLRKKLGGVASSYIDTAFGTGYRLMAPSESVVPEVVPTQIPAPRFG